MQKQKAVAVINEIGSFCKLLNPKAISLEVGRDADHFEIHIEGYVDDESWECLKKLARKHDLGIKLTNEMLVIYAPGSESGTP